MNTQTVNLTDVTILYYPDDNPYHLRALLLKNQVKNQQGRVVISAEHRQGKIIVAVISGQVELLNMLGDRFNVQPLSAA
ncbi:DUF2375 family protein [Agarivorans sp. MS3-6]|uniref:DUF2375 family protein n=1 Tax=Agarivorans sp. TSD2052 TaxID=2937286 RepID=UPI00200E5326|nr:DUF2375 family protein [Agarivorans sp. TSD2052]UPW17842.1 TIGR02922 family protein [Agarivorans sp. TSD2052]